MVVEVLRLTVLPRSQGTTEEWEVEDNRLGWRDSPSWELFRSPRDRDTDSDNDNKTIK